MDQNQTNPGTQNPATPAQNSGTNSTTPLLIGFAVLIVLAAAAWFVMNNAQMKNANLPGTENTMMNPEEVAVGADDTTAAAIATQGTSDEVADIEADLKATDMGALDGIDSI